MWGNKLPSPSWLSFSKSLISRHFPGAIVSKLCAVDKGADEYTHDTIRGFELRKGLAGNREPARRICSIHNWVLVRRWRVGKETMVDMWMEGY